MFSNHVGISDCLLYWWLEPRSSSISLAKYRFNFFYGLLCYACILLFLQVSFVKFSVRVQFTKIGRKVELKFFSFRYKIKKKRKNNSHFFWNVKQSLVRNWLRLIQINIGSPECWISKEDLGSLPSLLKITIENYEGKFKGKFTSSGFIMYLYTPGNTWRSF